MPAKRKSQLIYLILVLIICLSAVNLLRRYKIFPFNTGDTADRPGRWRSAEYINSKRELTENQEKMIERLKSIGYLSGTKPAPELQKVTIHNKIRAGRGVNLIVSGHAPEAILIDMDGNQIHKWSCDAFRAWPGISFQNTDQHTFWRRAHLMKNGDMLAVFEGIGLIKLDKHSNLIWSRANGAHHDLYVARDGNIYVLTRKSHLNKKYNSEKPILEDYVSVLDSTGREIRSISILEAIEKSNYAHILKKLKKWGDLLHTNTIELIETDAAGLLPEFKRGNVLISTYWLNFVGVIDMDKGAAVWGMSGLWEKQHQPTLLDDGTMLVFDNLGVDPWSRVLEIDPVSKTILWQYRGSEDEPFFTPTCGSCQRLSNGNTLITESDPGRAFEVTADKTIVWEYINPHRAGQNNELIATLFELVRYEPDYALAWIE
jgi:hypothetical protein